MSDDFIGVYENAIPVDVCELLVKDFEVLRSLNLVQNRQQQEGVPKTMKDTDNILFSDALISAPLESARQDLYVFTDRVIKDCIGHYRSKYATLLPTVSAPMSVFAHKMQYAAVGGGYHIWHFESSGRDTSGRVLFYIAYLNDVEEGGETEFLYIPKRVKPKTGTVVVAPCAFTHTHRGNPPISNGKYIITGWLEF